MQVKFLDLNKQYDTIKTEIDAAIKRVVDSQYFVLGEELENFEKEFAKYLGVKYVVGVGSGTDALILSLVALGIGKGDEVITPVNSFIATTIAIAQVGAIPVFVDCDPDNYQIDVKQVAGKITKKTKAILPVHLYGASFAVDQIQKIANENNLFVVEDAAQAHGATFNGKRIGGFGDLTAWSFYPSKNLGAYGDGSAISTNSEALYEKLLKLRNYGQEKKYYHITYGVNSRLDEIQAAVLRVKLRYLDKWNKQRSEVAEKYINRIRGYKFQKLIHKATSSYYIFSVEHENRNKLQKFLEEKGIQSLIHYPVPIHLQEVFKQVGHKKGDFPVAEGISDRILSLPMYPELDDSKIDYIIAALNIFNEHN